MKSSIFVAGIMAMLSPEDWEMMEELANQNEMTEEDINKLNERENENGIKENAIQ